MRAILDEQPDDSSFAELLRALAEGNADGVDADQIAERLRWSPAERLRYLLDTDAAHSTAGVTEDTDFAISSLDIGRKREREHHHVPAR